MQNQVIQNKQNIESMEELCLEQGSGGSNENTEGRRCDGGSRTPHLSIHCLLKASSYMFTLRVVRSERAVTIVTIATIMTGMTGVTGVWVSAPLLSGWLLHTSWLGALLHRVGPLCDDRSLSRLDTRYLVDLDLGLWRMLNVDIHQGWMERHWRRTDTHLIE